jgi:antibiotic biosynthesis monooxygenase (ABM) superfamily enzyme
MPTLIVKRLIEPGFERAYEDGLANIIDDAEKMDGYLGANIARPSNKEKPLYIYSVKFDSQKHLQMYKDSTMRQQFLKEWHEHSQKPIEEHTIHGIDWWFVLPGGHSEIPRYKMVFLTISAAYPIVLLLNIFINGAQNLGVTAIKIFFVIVITISLMSYVTMPFLLNFLKDWLEGKK